MDEFTKRTAIIPEMIVESVLRHREHELPYSKQQEFVSYCNRRIRQLYQINERWKCKLNSKGNAGRDYCYMFVNHWLDAYLLTGRIADAPV